MATQQRQDTERKNQARSSAAGASTAPATTDQERSLPVSSETRQPRAGSSHMRGLIPMSPWDLMRRMGDELDQLVQGLGVARPTARSGGNGDLTEWVPRIEVQQRPDALKVRADLPGLRPEDVQVSVDDGMLTIRGERRQERTTEDDGVVRSEVVYGSFFRALPLPEGANDDRIDARFRNGVLEITVPVEGHQAGRRIPVQSEATT